MLLKTPIGGDREYLNFLISMKLTQAAQLEQQHHESQHHESDESKEETKSEKERHEK